MTLGSIKKMLYQFVLSSMVFFILTQLLSGFEISGQPLHWLMMFVVFGASNLLVIQLIKFFTIPKNILTYWLASMILSFAAFYVMDMFLPGITIGETIIDPVSAGIISVEPYIFSPILTMVLAGVVSGLFNAVLYWLDTGE